MDSNKNDAMKIQEEKRQARTLENMEIKLSEQMEMMKQLITTSAVISIMLSFQNGCTDGIRERAIAPFF